MEIRRWLLCVVINCAIVSHLVAKPVSLNELIAAEAKQKLEQHTKSTESKPVSLKKLAAESEQKNKKSQNPKSTIKTAKTVSLNELIAAESKQKDNKYQNTAATTKTKKESSPSESRQKFEKTRFFLGKKPRRKPFSLKDFFDTEKSAARHRIESLLSKTSGGGLRLHRSKFLPTLSHKPFEPAENIFSLARTITPLKFRKRFEIRPPLKPKKLKYSFTPRLRRNQSTKREANENALFNHRHIPLIKRIGLLVDNILSPNSGESLEPIRRRKPRRKKLSGTTDLTSSESKPQKTSVVAPTTVPPETTNTEDPTSQTPDATTYSTSFGDIYTLRPDTDLSLPPTGNTSSYRRDDHGIGEGSGTAFHGDFKRYIARYNGSDEYNTDGRTQTYSSHNEEDSHSSARVDERSDGYRNGADTRDRNDIHKTEKTETENSTDSFIRRNDADTKATLQIRGETLQIPRDVRRLPRLPDKIFIVDAEPVSPQKSGEEGFVDVSQHHTSTERGTDWNGTASAKDQRLREVIQGMTPINHILHPNFLAQRTQDNHVVAIFDGYSVARDINGRSKLTEK